MVSPETGPTVRGCAMPSICFGKVETDGLAIHLSNSLIDLSVALENEGGMLQCRGEVHFYS